MKTRHYIASQMSCGLVFKKFATQLTIFIGFVTFTLSCSKAENERLAPRPSLTDSSSQTGTDKDPAPLGGDGLNVYNGTASSDAGVGALTKMANDDTICSAVEISPRCVLTAGHCYNLLTPGSGVYVQENNSKTRTREIPIVRNELRNSGTRGVDLALFWTTKKSCLRDKRSEVDCGSTPTWSPRTTASPPSLFQPIQVVGYGYSSAALNFGVKHSGDMLLSEIVNIDDSDPFFSEHGQYIKAIPNSSGVCQGDSGGAWLYGGDLVGITHAVGLISRTGNYCDPANRSADFATSFGNTADTWLATTKAKFCRAGMSVSVLVSNEKDDSNVGGRVEASIGSTQKIRCGNLTGLSDTTQKCSATSEPMETSGPYFAQITLNAINDSGRTFIRWETISASGKCPCSGSSSSCTVIASEIDSSIAPFEGAGCKAIFSNPPLPTMISTSTAPTTAPSASATPPATSPVTDAASTLTEDTTSAPINTPTPTSAATSEVAPAPPGALRVSGAAATILNEIAPGVSSSAAIRAIVEVISNKNPQEIKRWFEGTQVVRP